MGDLLRTVLRDAQHRGYLGPGEVDQFIGHALGYLEGLGDAAARAAWVDLGSGSGVPGLVLAVELGETSWYLVERSRARADWLRRSVARLGLDQRVVVLHEAAETTGRGPLRANCAVVVARCFAGPAVAAECAAPLLMVGGHAVFSDLQGTSRWDEPALGVLGLAWIGTYRREAGTYTVLEQRESCPGRFPRSPGVPVRRPLF
jgi:16S rRNA (guanine527-N7)-methyltransferase